MGWNPFYRSISPFYEIEITWLKKPRMLVQIRNDFTPFFGKVTVCLHNLSCFFFVRSNISHSSLFQCRLSSLGIQFSYQHIALHLQHTRGWTLHHLLQEEQSIVFLLKCLYSRRYCIDQNKIPNFCVVWLFYALLPNTNHFFHLKRALKKCSKIFLNMFDKTLPPL